LIFEGDLLARYAAFLRGINVGGNKPVRMDELKAAFESMGFSGVETYIQSGNVAFNSGEKDTGAVGKKVGKALPKKLGFEVSVFVRSQERMKEFSKLGPESEKPEEKQYVAFLSDGAGKKLEAGTESKDGMAIERVLVDDAFVTCRIVKGKFAFPNAWLEKLTGAPATTRNWNTVRKMAESG
jgi:uncharacterized protein (DUF1697 family)